MVVNAEVNQTNKTTLRSARRSVVENSLTGPTLVEMSGYPTLQNAVKACQELAVSDNLNR